MAVWFELTSNFVQVFAYAWFVTKLFGFKKNSIKYKILFFLTVIAGFVELSFINHVVVYDGLLSGIVTLTITIYSCCCLKGEFTRHVFVNLFATTIIFSIASLAIFITSYLSGIYAENMISVFSSWRVGGVCLCRICEFLIYKAIIKLDTEYTLTKKEWSLFIALPFLSWLAITYMTKAVILSNDVLTYMLYIAFIMLFINIIIFFFMFKMKQDAKTKLEYELLKMQYNNIKNTEDNMKALYENTYSLKHDLEKHLLAIRTLAEKNDLVKMNTYIEQVFAKSLSRVQKIVFTDNDVLNAVINTKLAICAKKNIYPNISIYNEAVKYIRTEDVAVLFGNIFDNAIEAAEHTEKKIIILNIMLQGEYVSIYVENSYDPNYSNIELETTKKNKTEHGFGTKNIRKIVEQNGGMIQYFENGKGMFCCDILLKKCK